MMTDDLFFNQALSLIGAASAGDSLDLTTYFFAYRTEGDAKAKRIYEEILAAQARGAKVRLYLERNSNLQVNQDITKANLQTAKRFEDAGVTRVYLDQEDKISHAKIIKVSGPNRNVALIGSTNIYRGDFDENHQVNFLIEHEDSIAALTAYLNQKFAYEGTRNSLLQGGHTVPMMRFWRGYKQHEVANAEFQTKLNTLLIPELGAVGIGRGLRAYLPALFPEAKPDFLPDEVALINYASEESYDAIRSTPRGEKYGPLHFSPGLFAKEAASGLKSGSTLAEAWSGNVTIGKAYLVGQDTLDWQDGRVELRTLLRPANMHDDDFAETVKAHITALANQANGITGGAIVLVDGKYIMELRQHSSQAEGPVPAHSEDSNLTLFNVISMLPQTQDAIAIDFGTGATMQFPTEPMSPSQLIEPVLSSF
jgi:hypothetical protein